MHDGLPWPRLLGLCIAGLGWGPQDFWQATPSELMAALEFREAQLRGLDSVDIAQLKQQLASTRCHPRASGDPEKLAPAERA